MSLTPRVVTLALIAVVASPPLRGEIVGATRIATGLSSPIVVAHAPGDTSRLFIGERGGSVRIFDLETGTLLPSPLVSIPGVLTSGEGGLLGLAFHPDFANNGKFYVNVTRSSGTETFLGANSGLATQILEYTISTRNPNQTTGAARTILSFVQPQNNHNGGWIGFSPHDGYLYIATGDGGNANDTHPGGGHTPEIGNAQDLYLEDAGNGSPARNLLGKMLRIEVNGSSTQPSDDFPDEPNRNYAIPDDNPFAGGVIYDDEIWAYGLRNPFRSSFDRATGDLWIGDVGQNAREEINFQPASSPGGENYGWRSREGTLVTGLGPIIGEPNDLVPPVYEYGRGTGTFEGFAVTGGYVYRGPDPELRGTYIFGDYVSEHIWQFDPANPSGTRMNIDSLLTPDEGTIDQIAAFGEDADGNLYIADLGGQVFRIDTTIALAGDYDGSGQVDTGDYELWKSQYGMTGGLPADGNGDQKVDASDYVVWRNNFGRSLALPPGALTTAPVPEPGNLAVTAVVALALWLRRRESPDDTL